MCPLCHIFAYNRANTRLSVLKNLTFPDYEFGEGQYAFYPIKLSSFAEKNKVHQKCQNFIREDPYKLSQTPLDQKNFQKSNIILEGFRYPNFMNPYE